MGEPVVMGANLKCSFGAAPSSLVVLPTAMVNGENKPMATIMDYVPMLNIMPFGMCQSMSNPQVAAATAAAMGVLTPMPCVPVVSAPWAPGSTKLFINNKPALTKSCKAMCMWGGNISIQNSGVTKIQCP